MGRHARLGILPFLLAVGLALRPPVALTLGAPSAQERYVPGVPDDADANAAGEGERSLRAVDSLSGPSDAPPPTPGEPAKRPEAEAPSGLAAPAAAEPVAPTPTSAPLALTPTPRARTILLADKLDDPTVGVLTKLTVSRGSVHAIQGYDGGEYVMKKPDPLTVAIGTVEVLPGEYTNASLAVDVRFVGPAADRFASISCRSDAGQVRGYFLDLSPHKASFRLTRRDFGTPSVLLTDWQPSPAIRPANGSNRLELSCVGSTIAASVNGTQVATVQDRSYREGRMALLAGANQGSGLTWEVRYRNLEVFAP